jgi:two-component system, LuxR family, sensor kinase FixL
MLAVRPLKPLHKPVAGVATEATGTWLERHASGTTTLIMSVTFVLLYVTLDTVSFVFPYYPFPVTPWNPNAGLAIAMMVTGGPRFAPAVIVATLISAFPLRAESASLLGSLVAGLGLGTAYVLTALTVRRLVPGATLERVRDLRLFFVVVVAGTALAAACFVQFNLPPGGVPAATWVAAFLRMWLGELTGTFCTSPILLLLDSATGKKNSGDSPGGEGRWFRDVVLFLLVLLPLLALIFGLEPIEGHKLFYLLFVPLIVLAMRRGFSGAAIGVAIVQVALIGVLLATDRSAQSASEFQLLMLVLALTTLLLGAVASERKRALIELERHAVELRAQQAALADALRVAAVSEMSSAMAHELAQPLSAIGSYARAGLEMLRLGKSEPADLARALERVEKEAAQSGKTVRRIRDFFRSGASELEPIDVDAWVEEAVSAIRDRAEERGVRVRVTTAPDVRHVLADRVQIRTVLHNLLTNALDAAVDAEPPASIEVAVRTGTPGWIAIDVIDSGRGVEPSLAEALFEPLATTKPTGMGLGLAISKTIAHAHGGQLALLDGRPTTFRLTLPVHGDAAP